MTKSYKYDVYKKYHLSHYTFTHTFSNTFSHTFTNLSVGESFTCESSLGLTIIKSVVARLVQEHLGLVKKI